MVDLVALQSLAGINDPPIFRPERIHLVIAVHANSYGPHKTLYNRFIRWSRLGVFDRIFAALAGEAPRPQRIMIDATHLKALRPDEGRPIIMLLSEGQMSDGGGAQWRW
ncbi:UNVERIFIED_ORG: putative transposase of IS4/5 family DUF4096 [Martelella mediterranea]